MLYNPFNFQSNDNWDTDGLYWYNEFYTKKPVWTGLNQFHGLQKTGPAWSSSVPAISGLVLDRLRSMVAHFGGKKPDWTGLANTICLHFIMPPPPWETWQQQLLLAAAYAINFIGIATTLYASPLYWKQDYHTSKLSGGEWVEELIYGLKMGMRQVIT